MMIGTLAVPGVRRSRRQTSIPEIAFDHPVEQDDVGRRFLGQHQRLLAVGRVLDVELLPLEMPFQQLDQAGIVLDQQQAGLHAVPTIGCTSGDPKIAHDILHGSSPLRPDWSSMEQP